MQFVPKDAVVTALQYTGHNPEELLAWLGEEWLCRVKDDRFAVFASSSAYLTIRPEDWLVRDHCGSVSGVDAADIPKLFLAYTPPAVPRGPSPQPAYYKVPVTVVTNMLVTTAADSQADAAERVRHMDTDTLMHDGVVTWQHVDRVDGRPPTYKHV